jgi:nucleoside-diphosphate-sugar epimerase
MSEKAFYSDLVGRRVFLFLTGATGFVGSRLSKRLIKEGCEVHISVRKSSSLWRIEDVMDNCICHTIDLTDFDDVKSLIEKIKPSYSI